MRYSATLALLLAAQSQSPLHGVDAFQSTSLGLTNAFRPSLPKSIFRQEVSAYAPAENSEDIDSGSGNLTATSEYFTSLVSDAVQSEDDAEEIQLAERRRKITERGGTYRVTLPMRATTGGMGMSIRQYIPGCEITDDVLHLDPLVVETVLDDKPAGTVITSSKDVEVDTIEIIEMKKRLDPNGAGLYVCAVQVGSPAWDAGIRAGDLLISTAATFGDALWPKTTLDGVRSALTSRRMVNKDATLELKRTDVVRADNVYELTLTRPIGLNLRETDEGYVEVVGYTANAPNLVRQAVRVGDRVIAVDSSLGGQLWPVSTVEGVISACTSRLPGQRIAMQFERPQSVMEASLTEEQMVADNSATLTQQPSIASTVVAPQDQKKLLQRCRDILRRYTKGEQGDSNAIPQGSGAKFVDKFAVPAIVADKVMEALAKANASLDSVTLSMIMDAYLSCDKPNGAIRVFQAATGYNGNGSVLQPSSSKAAFGGGIQSNSAALNVYTISSLLQAHAMKKDLKSVRRVVAAMEGRAGDKVSGLETAAWPGTGSTAGGADTILLDTQCYNIAIAAAGKAGTPDGLELAMRLFDSLEEPSIVFKNDSGTKAKKNAATYNSIISALSMEGRFDDAFSTFFNMKRVGLKPDKFTYTSLLKACVNDGDLQELLFDMKEQGVKEDVVMYNAMIRSRCEEGKLAEARNLINQMESRGVSPNSMTYGILMKGLLQASKPGACLALFESACNNPQTSPVTENVFLYTTAISAASVLKDHERAIDLVSRMSALGIKPNTKTLTALMGACLANEKPDLAAEVYIRIDRPDGYAMSKGLEALCQVGDLSSAAAILADQRRGSRDLSGKQLMHAYETIVVTAVKNSDFEVARSMFSELLAKSYIPSKGMLRNIVSAMKLMDKGHIMLEHTDRDPAQFEFLLFIIDSLIQRNLAVDAFLYAGTISCGCQLADRQRAVADILVHARLAGDESKEKVVSLDEDPTVDPVHVRWQDLMVHDDVFHQLRSKPALIAPLKVTIGKRDLRTVLFSEKLPSRVTQVDEQPMDAAST